MAVTYDFIASATSNGSTTELALTSIPQTYNDLVVVLCANSALTSAIDNLILKANNNTSSEYNMQTAIRADGSNSFVETQFDGELNYLNFPSMVSANEYEWGHLEIDIPGYTLSEHKAQGNYQNFISNQSYAQGSGTIASGIDESPKAPITELDFTLTSGSAFVSGSSVRLYGIKNT
jgi:hypothetical protein